MKALRKLVLKGINRMGYDLVRPDPNPRGFIPEHLRTVATPRTVIDVGVGYGTYPLYEAFPDAKFILIEPLEDYAPAIDVIASKYDCRVYYKAVGSSEGMVTMNVDVDDLEKSSTRSKLATRGHRIEARTVPVTTLDSILADQPFMAEPVLLKLDVEGHEIDAIEGATRLLEKTDTVISEVSVAERFQGGYQFEDFLFCMRDRGFRVVDILSIAHSGRDLEPRHMDVMFKRARSRAAAG